MQAAERKELQQILLSLISHLVPPCPMVLGDRSSPAVFWEGRHKADKGKIGGVLPCCLTRRHARQRPPPQSSETPEMGQEGGRNVLLFVFSRAYV